MIYGTMNPYPFCDRLCINCNDVEDEIHFLVYCKLYEESRNIFYQKVARRNSDFVDFTDHEKYIFLMKNTDPFILVWFGNYVFKLFNIRTEHNMMLYWRNDDIRLNCWDRTLHKISMIISCTVKVI